VWEL
jgi:hypothetical protein